MNNIDRARARIAELEAQKAALQGKLNDAEDGYRIVEAIEASGPLRDLLIDVGDMPAHERTAALMDAVVNVTLAAIALREELRFAKAEAEKQA